MTELRASVRGLDFLDPYGARLASFGALSRMCLFAKQRPVRLRRSKTSSAVNVLAFAEHNLCEKVKLTIKLPEISDCDREPIHIPGSIQPHGVMLVADFDSLIVRYRAGEVDRILQLDAGNDRPLSDFIGQNLAKKAAAVAEVTRKGGFVGTIERADNIYSIDVTSHASGDYLIVELEFRQETTRPSTEILGALEFASAGFDQTTTLKSLCEAAAFEFRRLTRYDRVMVYRFLDNGAGAVIAEDRRSDLHSFLNHHFPGSDIPQQARALYVRNLVRVIPDVDYVASYLTPDWSGDVDLDMSDSILRSVSPIHLQYLKNMGVAASASISIVKDGALWGLIACHNEMPRIIPNDIRAACRSLASTLARQIKAKEETDVYRERLRLRGSEDDMIGLLSREGSLEESLSNHLDELCQFLAGDGFVVMRGNDVAMTGACPSGDDVRRLATWLLGKSAEAVFATERLAQTYPAANAFQKVAAGVMAVPLSIEERWLLIWFRAEEIQVVKWAGNPHKSVDLEPGEILSPRASFEAWQETVHGHSRRWTLAELEAAARIRQDLIEVRQNRRLKELNRQLTGTVAEKDLLLEQKQYLIGEVNHRVQNSLQLVSGFLSLQAKDSSDPTFSQAVEEARRRISAVSLLHRRLYRGDEIGVADAGRYIDDLCNNLVATMGSEWKNQFSLDLAPVMLPIDRMIPLGLVVTELVININKYAYGSTVGPIAIKLTEDLTKFRLVVSDKGRGRISGRPGFGTRMMTALVAQLSGELDFEDANPGLRAILSAPILS